MIKLLWKTEQRKINDLIPFKKNPRKISAAQIKQLQKSLEKFNLVEIPAINMDNKIIADHQRLKILQRLNRGEEIIDVRIPNRKLTDEEFKEYLLRSNKNQAEWDFDLLKDFDSDLLFDVGFEEVNLDNTLNFNEIEEITNFSTSINFIVKCDNLKELEFLKQKLEINSNLVKLDTFLKALENFKK